MVLAIDFDHTIHNPDDVKPGFRMGEPMPGAVDALLTLHRHGDTIIIFTARDRFQPVEEWLQHFGIPYSRVTNVKPPEAEVFIDDRGLRFRGDWSVTLDELAQI